MAQPQRSYTPSNDSSALSPIYSSNASQSTLSHGFPPRSSSARPPKARRGSTASSVISMSSVGTAMDWRISKDFGPGSLPPGVGNSTSISTLVETPQNARNSNAARPRPGEIPPVTLTQIPKIKPSAFSAYLAIAPEYARYQRAKDQGMEEHIRLQQKSSQDPQGLLSPTVLSPTPSVSDLTALADDAASRGTSPRKRGRRGPAAVTPLSTVPQVYFDADFHLENPRTFDIVSERSEVIQPSGPAKEDESETAAMQSQRKALATNAILQEKLSWYMDTVEVHLVQSISTASSSFFAALGDLRDLHSEAATSVKKIQGLRKELVRLDEEQAKKGLEIVRLRRRRDNVAKLQRAVKQMERVTNSLTQAEKYLDDRDIETALDAVDQTEKLFNGTAEEGLTDLRGVRALDAVATDLTHLRFRIGREYESRFVECLLSDLRRHVQSASSQETLRRWAQSFQREQYNRHVSAANANHFNPPPRSSSLPPEYTVLSNDLREQLMEHLNGLQRANHVNNAVQAYRDSVIREVKNLIRGSLPSNDDDADSVSSGVSRRSNRHPRTSSDKSVLLTRQLSPSDAEDLFVTIYTNVSELIRRLGTQQKMLLDVTMRMGVQGIGGFLSPRLDQTGFPSPSPMSPNSLHPGSPGPSRPTTPGGSDLMDISDLITSAVEISQTDIVKIVKLRTEQVARYPRDRLVRYFTLNRLFAQECEAVCVNVNPALRNAMNMQMKEWVNVYQNERMNNLAESLEKDKWAAKEFEKEQQDSLDRIVSSATKDPEEWAALGRLWEIRAAEAGESNSEKKEEEKEEEEKEEEEKEKKKPEVPVEEKHPATNETSEAIPETAPENDAKPPSPPPSNPSDSQPPQTNGTSSPITITEDPTPAPTPAPLPPTSAEPSKPPSSTHALIPPHRFILPASALLLLSDLESYLSLVIALPSATPDLAQSIIEFIKLFNSRTFQLIHGAGATRSAGLKSITTRHLAIASQALSIIITLLPYLSSTIRRHLPPPSTAPEFDRLRRATQEYQSEIHSKLVSIMSDRAKHHVVSIKSMNWDLPAPDLSVPGTKYYMETLCKETGVLYKVLMKHLPVDQVRGIMEPVFRDYEEKLGEAYKEATVRSEDAKRRMCRDVEGMRERLGECEGEGGVGERLLRLVEGKVVTPGRE